MHYKKLNDEIQRRYNEFPMEFAFSDKQLEEGLQKLGVVDTSEVVSIGGGGFIRRTDIGAFNKMVKECNNLHKYSIANDDEYVLTMFEYELGNHEYCITMDLTDTLRACDVTEDEILHDNRLNRLLCEAVKNYKAQCIEW